MTTVNLVILILGTILITWVSRTSLQTMGSHGFYRFFAWEAILVMFVLNDKYWFRNPFSPCQLVAWTLLIISLVLILWGVAMFRRRGKIDRQRSDPSLVGIEKTTELVTTGVYRFIRHPFYSSLLFLAWGIAFKNLSWLSILLVIFASAFLYLTARKEEQENLQYFGDAYRVYMHSTKMFIPYLF